MRNITIVGAGQAGLQLGIGLLDKGYSVTAISNRTGEEIANGKVLSSQSMYDMALSHERELGIAFWDEECPPIEGIHVQAGNAQAGTTPTASAALTAASAFLTLCAPATRRRAPSWTSARACRRTDNRWING